MEELDLVERTKFR